MEGVEHEDGVERLVDGQVRPRRARSNADVGQAPGGSLALGRAPAPASMSKPTKLEAGNSAPRTTRALPLPQPTSATRAPAVSRSTSPGASGRMAGTSRWLYSGLPQRVHDVVDLGDERAVRARRRRDGRPRRPRGTCLPSMVVNSATGARFSTPSRSGTWRARAAASRLDAPARTRRCRSVAIAPSHSRTYRSFSPARAQSQGWCQAPARGRLEQAGALTDVDQAAQGCAGEQLEQATAERLDRLLVDRAGSRCRRHAADAGSCAGAGHGAHPIFCCGGDVSQSSNISPCLTANKAAMARLDTPIFE